VSPAPVGFVGLGSMGGRMVKRLLDAGHAVVGYNRTAAKARWLVDAGMTLAASPREVAERADVVMCMVTDTRALTAVTGGETGLIAGLRPSSVYVEMSTVSPTAVRALGEMVARRGATMLDAPVSGSIATLDSGQLSFMVGGDVAALERVRPYLLAIGPTITHMGALGLAVTLKVASNQALAVQILSFAESVCLAEKAGIPRATAVEALLRSVIASPVIKYRGPFVLGMPAEAWFDVGMIQKDLDLALELGHQLGVPLPTGALTQEWMTAARGAGLGSYDFAVVFDIVARLSGLPPTPKAAT